MKKIEAYKERVDMSDMVTGVNTLGYENSEVDRTVNDGSVATFNYPEGVYLLKKLVGLHPRAKSDNNVC